MRRAHGFLPAAFFCGLLCTSACQRSSDAPARSAESIASPSQAVTTKSPAPDSQVQLDRDTSEADAEQIEYARASRERLRAIEARAQELRARRAAIPADMQGDAAATLNLLPREFDETEREIDALEVITSTKWQQKRGKVDRNLANLERSLERVEKR